jgi:hypothetical protein
MSFKNHYTGVPDYKKVVLRFNTETAWFERVACPIGFNKVPTELKLEDSQREDYQNKGAKLFIRSRTVNKQREFQTGLIYTGRKGLYFGDHYHPKEKQANSFCLFYINESNTELTVFYFNHFKVYPKQRERLIELIVRNEKIV